MLLNAVAGANAKFSITHGLRSRADDAQIAKDPVEISKHLFGANADHSKATSFVGLT